MSIAERKAFVSALTASLENRAVMDSFIPRGGDLFITPVDLAQQKALLDLNQTLIADRLISCSLPKSTLQLNKGIISGVPISDDEETILDALRDQCVVNVQRAPRQASDTRLYSNIYLSFSSPIPPRVRVASVSYEVRQYFPSLYRCKTCWRIGHTSTHCSSAPVCKKCGTIHPRDQPCSSSKCLNCKANDHEADSPACPAFIRAKSIIRYSILNKMSIREASLKFLSLFSTVTDRNCSNGPIPPTIRLPNSHSPSNDQSQNAIQDLKDQLISLQEQVNTLKDATIPSIVNSVSEVKSDLEHLKSDCSGFNSRFDTIDKHFIDLKNTLDQMFKSPRLVPGPMLATSSIPQPVTNLNTSSAARTPLSSAIFDLISPHEISDTIWAEDIDTHDPPA